MRITEQFALPHGAAGRLVGKFMAFGNAPQVRAVVAEARPKGSERVLEIGFGPGVGLEAIAESGMQVRVFGVDPSAEMVAAAERRTERWGQRVSAEQGRADQLPYKDAHFDVVCATNSAQLWQPLDTSLAEVLRVMKPGGRLVLGVHQRAVLPAGGTAGPEYDQVLLPAVEKAGFTGATAQWRMARGGQALFLSAVRP